MIIDFHTHAKLSKGIPVDLEEFTKKMNEAKEAGLTALALTEHFNAPDFLKVYDMLDHSFPYDGHTYDVNGLTVFPGMEIDVKEVGHYLVVGNRDDIRSISMELTAFTPEDNFIPISDLFNLLAPYNVLKIGAHPLRKSTPLHHHDPALLKQFDAFDLNGKDLFKAGPEMEKLVAEFADQYGVPVVGGSDTHHFLQYGAISNRFEEVCRTVDELKEAIRQQQYQTCISDCLDVKVRSAALIKKELKEQITI
ncbi:PHP-associated domain-containing protein [Jeotgalibacillus sp. ET6]|uniref:PHP-associated domain-containing protein n=1 Tax=Jeotgalibacillus sp. ET6 TaxID=3037260 RepID=UPI0024184F7D|nr:PHP-associated domain-containing protein [Jeotgalibacillus sp. ET6]MDG5472033.1 PHP-associated domain-containing protein [Jeotgalibacillus sp. ET6]